MHQIAIVVAIAFWALLLSGGVLIALSENRPAQRFLGAILGATVLSAAADMFLPREQAAYAYLTIDGILLATAIYFVLKSTSYWPIWFAGFHSISVASEVARLIYSGSKPGVYLDVAGFWSIPALLAMVIGVYMDRRFRQSEHQARNTQIAV